MNTRKQIEEHIAAQPEPKRGEMRELHRIILAQMPKCKLWFLDGRDDKGKIVSNPNIGYGLQIIKYADGRTRDFYQVGLSANTTEFPSIFLASKTRIIWPKHMEMNSGRPVSPAIASSSDGWGI
jgi:hypothetical protein